MIIESIGNYTVSMSNMSEEHLEFLYNYLVVVDTDKQSLTHLAKKSGNTLTFKRGLLEFVYIVFPRLHITELEFKLAQIPVIPINEKWSKILYENQLRHLKILLSYPNGLAKLYTGYGKTEMQLALIESYLEAFPEGNVLVFLPNSAVIETWQQRCKKWKLETIKDDFSTRCTMLNPTGFMTSKRRDDLEIIKYISDARLILSDEVHHMSCDSWSKLSDLVFELDYSYGFSATIDSRGDSIPYSTVPVYSLNEDTGKIVSLTGPVRTAEVPRAKEVDILMVSGEIGPKLPPRDENSKKRHTDTMKIMDEFMLAPILAKSLAKIIKSFRDRIYYIPVHKTTTGKKFREMLLEELNEPVIYWDSKSIVPNYLKDLEDVRAELTEGRSRVLISTTVSYEGVDIPCIDSAILMHGSNARMILQPLGRSTRGSNIQVVLVYDTNNPVILSQAKKRRERIEENYTVNSKQIIKI